jgi:hypothetical protein
MSIEGSKPWKFLNSIRKTIDRILSEPEPPQLDLGISPDAQESLHKLANRPNPRLSEAPFIGLGSRSMITEIVVPQGVFSPNSGLLQDGFLGSRTDINELQQLFDQITRQGRLDEVVILGHLHPSGQTRVKYVTYTLAPNDGLLYPSSGGNSNPQSGGDLAFYKAFHDENLDRGIPYAGIIANTPDGPKLRVYDMDGLTKVKRYSEIDRVPQITVKL